ncbi:MAG: hypothetical protein ABIH47_00120 [Candidatus Omnitrophota bacterium]
MTPAQKKIRHLQRKAKRTTKDTMDTLLELSRILRAGKYPRGCDFLGVGSGNFYQCVMVSNLALRRMKRKTRNNTKEWSFHDERIQRLLQIANGHSG